MKILDMGGGTLLILDEDIPYGIMITQELWILDNINVGSF